MPLFRFRRHLPDGGAHLRMEAKLWFIILGLVFSALAFGATFVRRMPLTTAMIYLPVGWLLGPYGIGLLHLDFRANSPVILHIAEAVVFTSLFSAGLKLRAPWPAWRWGLVLRLAFLSMTLTVGMIALAGRFLLGLPWGAAILLGGLLAPTDPVLASDVELNSPHDSSPPRFGLTGEAGLNDGSAFPFVLLGLGLLGLPGGSTGWRWAAVDVLWGVGAGLGIGYGLGTLIGYGILHLRRRHHQAIGLAYFLTPGLIALCYGVALFANAYGFLSVFAAGVALRQIELRQIGENPPDELTELAVAPSERREFASDPVKAPVWLVQLLLQFTQEIERIGEVIVVAIVGAMLSMRVLSLTLLWFAPLLFLVIRPSAIMLVLLGSKLGWRDRAMIGWFGIRGIGTVYYLAYAFGHGLPPALSEGLAALALGVIAVSVIVHGISVTPLMRLYEKRQEG